MMPQDLKAFDTPEEILEYAKSENPQKLICVFIRDNGDASVMASKYDRTLYITALHGLGNIIKEIDYELYKAIRHEQS